MKLKRITTLLLTIITIVISANLFVSAQNYLPFTDVKSTDWFYNDVYLAYGRGLINGKSRDMFAPNDYLKYSEAVKLAACMRIAYFDEEPLEMSGKFWYEVYVDYCKIHGIIDKDYEWDAYATRADFMEIFAAALPDNALKSINAVEDGAIPDVPMYHKNVDAIYKLYRAGIVQGSDNAHRCNPVSNVKRSEVAAILTRMMYEYARLEFSLYLEDDKDSDGNVKTEEEIMNDRDDRDDDEKEETKPTETEKPEEVEPEKFPWEEPGVKQPKDYTWEEYQALPESLKDAFIESFENPDDYDEWMNHAQGNVEILPWEELGAKQPKDYTWEEYQALPESLKDAFIESFENPDELDKWMNKTQGIEDILPWEKSGAKQPKDYTWEEYQALPESLKDAFIESFENPDELDKWMNKTQGIEDILPWEKSGAKKPKEYTWDEYQALPESLKDAFVESFEDPDEFVEWFDENQV